MQLINNTRDGFNTIKEELRPLRLMVLEHRYVLDQLTAMNCGVCAKIGKSCCTFILANDADKGTLTKAIEDLDNLGKQMREEGVAEADIFSNWFNFDWMPSWLSAVLKIIMPIFCLLMLVCCGAQIIIHCVKRFSTKVVGMNYAETGIYSGIYRGPGKGEEENLFEIVELTMPSSHSLKTLDTTCCQHPIAPLLPPGRELITQGSSMQGYEDMTVKDEGQ